jgi:hypothetical protein
LILGVSILKQGKLLVSNKSNNWSFNLSY